MVAGSLKGDFVIDKMAENGPKVLAARKDKGQVEEAVALVDIAFLLRLNQANKRVLPDTQVNLVWTLGENLETQDLLVKETLKFQVANIEGNRAQFKLGIVHRNT